MSKLKKFHYAWIILVAVSLIRGIAGPALNGSSGLFLSPVSQELGIGIGQLSIYLSISSITMLFWLPIAGNILNKYSAKTIAIIGILLQGIPFVSLGFMNSVWGWYIMSVPLAMGAVLLVNLLGPVLINRWFVANRGLVMGLMMTITSLLGAVFQPLLSGLIANNGWRFTYVSFGAVSIVCIIILAVIFLKDKPGDKNTHPYGYDTNTKNTDKETKNNKNLGVSSKVATKSLAFFMLLVFMISITGFAVFSQHITTYGLSVGYSIVSIGTALSLSMIGSAIGSILIGVFSDKLGIMTTSISVVAVGLLAIILFLFAGDKYAVFMSATFLHGLSMSSIGVVSPILTSTFFGSKEYEKIFSLVSMGSPLASILLVPIYGFIYDKFGSYNIVLVFLIVLLAIGGICLIIGNKNSKKLDLADKK
ncbi:MFS transporter [Clostridioides sp. ES-S-0010-02]|uniref:MFS transporter n=1 Tax=Clostridioides sp. ES-S-0010-02 TaxID=2770776 RepID=UPI001D11FB26|nr:MFS transporter [Clostridioides sp. ES-S-0010-02]